GQSRLIDRLTDKVRTFWNMNLCDSVPATDGESLPNVDVGEIHVPEGSDFIGKTIDESGLPEQDINVLTLYRGTTVIPNPRLKRKLEPGDRLLCFGKLEAMRGMIPEKTRRRRRPKLQQLETDVPTSQPLP
ncbi:MAG: TrkA C-terminal domain-containing protein, partial [Planctomycetota bacterium]